MIIYRFSLCCLVSGIAKEINHEINNYSFGPREEQNNSHRIYLL